MNVNSKSPKLNRLRLRRSLFFSGIALSGVTAFAQNVCRDFLVAPAESHAEPTAWNDLPDLASVRLPREFVDLIDRHRIAKELRQRFGNGFDTIFELSPSSIKPTSQAMGASIQSLFLRQVILAIFPHAHFGYGSPREFVEPIKRLISFTVRESAFDGEGSVLKNMGRDGEVEISLLKATNPGPVPIKKETMRALIGLPQEAAVASVYASRLAYEDGAEVVRALLADKAVDVILLSLTNKNLLNRFILDEDEGPLPYDVVWASQLAHAKFNQGRRAVVLNDLKGQVPYFHMAADFAVIVGSGNGYEGIRAGVPTICFSKPDVAEGGQAFDVAAWSRQLLTLKRLGAQVIDRPSELLPAIARLKGLRGADQRISQPIVQGATALDRLLRNIKSAMQKQPGPFS